MNALLQQAVAHHARGDSAGAEAACMAALNQEPLNADAWHLRGVLAVQAAQPAKAIEYLSRAAGLRPTDYAILTNLGLALGSAKQYARGIEVLRRAAALRPDALDPLLHIGSCMIGLGQTVKAEEAYKQALTLNPQAPEPRESLGLLYFQLGRHDEAFDLAQGVLAEHPNRPLSLRLAGDILSRRQRYEEAETQYRKALSLQNDPVTRSNYALALVRMGRDAEALEHYDAAYPSLRENVQALESYAYTLLAAGRLEEGWRLYTARYKPNGTPFALRGQHPPVLGNARVAGKSILTWLDQGVGDQIMFASFLPELLDAGARIQLACDPRLSPIFRRSFPSIGIVSPDTKDFGAIDYQLYLPDAGQRIRPRMDCYPKHQGYLRADETATRGLRAKYAARGGLSKMLVGISWRTGAVAKVSAQKTLSLLEWEPILRVPGVSFVSLQYGATAEEIGDICRELGVDIQFDPDVDPMQDLDAFAAQVAAMDLVITTSNTTAHMAGALNKPAWTMVPKGFGQMWHWFHDRTDSPWYPSMVLLRQRQRADWPPVIAEAAEMLSRAVNNSAGRRQSS
jgi:tetratricopeptide (TPR) repeat protein